MQLVLCGLVDIKEDSESEPCGFKSRSVEVKDGKVHSEYFFLCICCSKMFRGDTAVREQ